MKKPIIELRNVFVNLGRKEILKDISFQVYEKEAIVIIGPSGSGKTVLLKTIAGIYTPNQGEVLIHGKKISDMNRSEKHKKFTTVMLDTVRNSSRAQRRV